MKKAFKVSFFVSLGIALIVLCSVVATTFAVNNTSASTGIIGGADGPTAIFVSRMLITQSPLSFVLCFSVVVFVISTIGWIATKNK